MPFRVIYAKSPDNPLQHRPAMHEAMRHTSVRPCQVTPVWDKVKFLLKALLTLILSFSRHFMSHVCWAARNWGAHCHNWKVCASRVLRRELTHKQPLLTQDMGGKFQRVSCTRYEGSGYTCKSMKLVPRRSFKSRGRGFCHGIIIKSQLVGRCDHDSLRRECKQYKQLMGPKRPCIHAAIM